MTFNSSTSLYQNSSAEETLKEIFCTGTRTVKVRKIQIDVFCLFSLGFGLLNRLAYPPGTCFYCNVKCQIKSKLWFHQSTYQGFQTLRQKHFFEICERTTQGRSLQILEFLKLITSFFHYFWCQNWDQWHKMSGRNTHIIFFTFGSKINEIERKKLEKRQKNSKNLKVAGNYPNI